MTAETWTIRVAQEYTGEFESADDAFRCLQQLCEREAHGLVRVDGRGALAPSAETPEAKS